MSSEIKRCDVRKVKETIERNNKLILWKIETFKEIQNRSSENWNHSETGFDHQTKIEALEKASVNLEDTLFNLEEYIEIID